MPFAAGGPTDAMARDIAQRTSTQLGQQIIIENVPGAGGTIGAAKAARSAPDGYSFLVGHMGYMGAAPSLYKKLAYDPVKDFEAVFRFPTRRWCFWWARTPRTRRPRSWWPSASRTRAG